MTRQTETPQFLELSCHVLWILSFHSVSLIDGFKFECCPSRCTIISTEARRGSWADDPNTITSALAFFSEKSYWSCIYPHVDFTHQKCKMHKSLSNLPCDFPLTSVLSSRVAPVQLCACGRLWVEVNSRSTGWTTVMWLTSWNRATGCPNLICALLPCTLLWPAAGAMTPPKDPPSPN